MQKQSVIGILTHHWPGVALAAGAALALVSWASSHDYVNGVVHVGELDRVKWQVGKIEGDVSEIKDGVKTMLQVQRTQGESIARLEGRK